jgi:hypothetical protein
VNNKQNNKKITAYVIWKKCGNNTVGEYQGSKRVASNFIQTWGAGDIALSLIYVIRSHQNCPKEVD